jgi:hypothetical protein
MRVKQWKLLAPFLKHHSEGNGGAFGQGGNRNGGNGGQGGGKSKSLFHTFFHF